MAEMSFRDHAALTLLAALVANPENDKYHDNDIVYDAIQLADNLMVQLHPEHQIDPETGLPGVDIEGVPVISISEIPPIPEDQLLGQKTEQQPGLLDTPAGGRTA